MKHVILTVSLCLLALPVFAAKHALVIGNSTYEHLPGLRNTRGDAKAYADAFTQLGFTVSHHHDLDEFALDDAIGAFLDRINPGDDVAFFFAGHGWSNDGINYLLPVDAPKDGSARRLARRSLALKNGVTGILDDIRATGAALQLAIVDACRDNPYAGGTRSVGASRGLARIVPEQGSFVVFSAGEGQAALDRLDNDPPTQGLSVFSRHFIPLLTSDMYLEDAVSEAQLLTANAAAAQNHLQTPAYYDQTLGKTCLRDSCVQTAAAVAALPRAKPSWRTRLQVPGLDELKARDAIAMPDGGVMVIYGYREFPGTPAWVGVARFDGSGTLMWDKRLEELKNKDEETFLVVAAMLPWAKESAAVFQRPNLVIVDADGDVTGKHSLQPKDHFLAYPYPASDGGFVIAGDGPIDGTRGDMAYKFVGQFADGAEDFEITSKIKNAGPDLKLYQTILQPGPGGSSVHQVGQTLFRGYDRDGNQIWQYDAAGAGRLGSIGYVALPDGAALIASLSDVTGAKGYERAELRVTHIAANGRATASAPENIGFKKFMPYVRLAAIRHGNGALLELISGDTQDHYFRRLNAKGRTLWTKNFGSKDGTVIATFADRGETGAVFLDFRRGDNTLEVIAVDDQGQ